MGAYERSTPTNVIKRRRTNLIGRTREPDTMRISRVLRPKLPASVLSRLIYSPVGYTMKHDEISRESTTESTVPILTVGKLMVSDLANKLIFVHRIFTWMLHQIGPITFITDLWFISEKQHTSALVQKVTFSDPQLRQTSENNATTKMALIFQKTYNSLKPQVRQAASENNATNKKALI
jgi:hypothetical protein